MKDRGKGAVLPTSQPNPYTKPFPPKCFKCQQPGHCSNECPLRLQVGLLGGNDPNGDYYSECRDAFAEAELVPSDDGDPVVCILQKLLFAPKQAQLTQHNAIFRTHCTINTKVYNVIIDSGSSENVVSKALVKALSLETEKHPCPYKIGWITKGVATKVHEV